MKYNLYKKRKRLVWTSYQMTPTESGLPMFIWIRAKHGKGKLGPWIQVSSVPYNGNWKDQDKLDIAIVTVNDDPQILFGELSEDLFNKLKLWIKKYKEDYIRMWNFEICQGTFSDIVEESNYVGLSKI